MLYNVSAVPRTLLSMLMNVGSANATHEAPAPATKEPTRLQPTAKVPRPPICAACLFSTENPVILKSEHIKKHCPSMPVGKTQKDKEDGKEQLGVKKLTAMAEMGIKNKPHTDFSAWAYLDFLER